ncbi:MAG: hypothetical protein IJS46_04180 [Kiritimatiellae bacterium]|nr:hypothetical protein [Kiritimatiellia bacterium]
MSVIDELFALQEQDATIKEFQKQVADIPKRRAREEAASDSHRAALEEAKAQLAEGDARIREIEESIETSRANVAKWEKVRAGLKSEAELRGMTNQIERAERERKDAELRLEHARAIVAAARESVAAAEAQCAESEAAAKMYIARLNVRLAETQRRLAEAQSARAALVSPLEAPEKRQFLSYYERLGRRFWPVAVRVGASSANCPGCHMALTASKLQEAHRNSLLADTPEKMHTVSCDYCGRLIFK